MLHHWVHLRVKKLSKRQRENLVKRSVLIIAVLEPLMTLPQIYEIWFKQQAAGVSAITWSLYISAAIVWLLYGIQLKDKPIVISSALWIAMEIGVVIGTVIYG